MTASLLLVGCGKMGGAMLQGWLADGMVERVVVIEPAGLPEVARHPAVTVAAGPDALPPGFRPDVVVLAVKPQVMDTVLPAFQGLARPGTVFLSIAAGKSLAGLARRLGTGAAVVRAMPNTPAAVGRGITVAVGNANVSRESAMLCDRLLQAVGEVAWIADEAMMDAVTAVSGSGPAYVFLLTETLARAGEAQGLPADLAMRLARATVAGAGELLYRTQTGAGALREAVTSPGGTTQAALSVLMASDGLEPLLERAIAAAAGRSRELAG
jgi:pyrroline-5-carboxylate reductase